MLGLFTMDDSSQFNSEYADGISLIDIQNLSPQEKHLINWIRQKGDCSLLDIAVHLCEDEETTMASLEPLVEKGFLLEVFGEDEPYYRVHFAPKRGRHLPSKLKGILSKKKS